VNGPTSFCSRSRRKKAEVIISIALACLALFWSGCGNNGMSAFTAPPRTLLSVAVQPGSAEATAPTGTSPFTASGTFDQAPTTQDNLTVQWSSSDPSIATIDADSGIATCVIAGGPVTITAVSGQKKGTAQLNCLAAPQSGSGHCVYQCGSTRCGSLTGYCAITTGSACRQVYDPGQCPVGRPAGATGTGGCGMGIDTTRSCSQ
jgi:hypothetical protein